MTNLFIDLMFRGKVYRELKLRRRNESGGILKNGPYDLDLTEEVEIRLRRDRLSTRGFLYTVMSLLC